jgi:ABC-type nickel/cobalt efflux system permease component RcnA
MDGETLILTEMVLTAALCLGFGFYQLWSLKRDKRKAAEAKAKTHAEGQAKGSVATTAQSDKRHSDQETV